MKKYTPLLLLLVPSLLFAAPEIPDSYFPPELDKPLAEYKNGNPKKTVSMINKIEKQKSANRSRDKLYLLEALAHKKLKDPARTKAALLESQKNRSSNSDMLYLLGVTEFKLGDKKKAVECLEEALWFNEFGIYSATNVKTQLGISLLSQGQAVKGKALLEEAKASDSPQALTELSKVYIREKKAAEATITAEKLYKLDSKKPEAQSLLAQALLVGPSARGNKKKAERAYTLSSEALKSDLDAGYKSDTQAAQIKALIILDREAEAEKVLASALKSDPQNSKFARLKKQIEIERSIDSGDAELEAPKAKTGKKKNKKKKAEG